MGRGACSRKLTNAAPAWKNAELRSTLARALSAGHRKGPEFTAEPSPEFVASTGYYASWPLRPSSRPPFSPDGSLVVAVASGSSSSFISSSLETLGHQLAFSRRSVDDLVLEDRGAELGLRIRPGSGGTGRNTAALAASSGGPRRSSPRSQLLAVTAMLLRGRSRPSTRPRRHAALGDLAGILPRAYWRTS